MIDVTALRALIAVRDHGTVAGAAQALGFTPSAVSQQVKRLERQSRAAMLERVGRRVVLTERGRLLADRGGALLAELEQVGNLALGDDAPLTGVFRIAAFSTACRGLVAPLLRRLATSAPELEVRVHEIDPRECLTMVERGGADLGVVHDWSSVPLTVAPALHLVPLLTDAADVVLPADHRLAGQDEVAAADLVHERWVSTHTGSICHDWLLQMHASHDTLPDVRCQDASFGTHVAMVEQGVAIALLPRLGREHLPPTVRAVPVVDPVSRRSVGAVWRRASDANPARRHVQAALERVAAEHVASRDAT
ncbi:LysR family transcriptional regulator [Aeromicrobium sp. IC_218]|uniref:LysR family transcriptional regulator n=1 Tax=Aeromicrobium sp. IC_218 TaxID=2545468 RepID=UPI00103C88ED|nr:LysR family transcriptional regulator [Aeromicrobium sp. IC_218]TCI99323.1 LysR family transcriptional regulator [Aeromicrobium sp. IC_218]